MDEFSPLILMMDAWYLLGQEPKCMKLFHGFSEGEHDCDCLSRLILDLR